MMKKLQKLGKALMLPVAALHDSDKYVLDLVKCQRFYRIIRDCGHQRGNNAGAQQVGHHQPGYQTGQCRGTLAVVG